MFGEEGFLGRIVTALAKLMALTGGAMLLGLVGLIVASVFGRALMGIGLRPIMGDYELVSAGIGFAVFAFLPWAHLNGGHAVVTLLTDRFPARVNAWIMAVTDLIMLAAAAFIAWRLWHGMLDKFLYGETTLLLRMPLGWAYAAAFSGAAIFVIVAMYVFARSLALAISGRPGPSNAGVGP